MQAALTRKQYIIMLLGKVGFGMRLFGTQNLDPGDSWSGFLILGWIGKSRKTRNSGDRYRDL